MKIERGSVTITDIPYFDSIEVMPSGILLTGGTSAEQTHTLADIEALRDALTEAIRIDREMSGAPTMLSRRVFNENDAEPGPEVTKVRDTDGDAWYRQENGWNCGVLRGVPWVRVGNYGPLADITHA